MESATQFAHAAKATVKYLSQHAELEAQLRTTITARCGQFAHGLTIPSYAEGKGVSDCLKTVPSGARGPVLIVLVVNAPREAPASVHVSNADSLEVLRAEYGAPEVIASEAYLYPHPAGSLVVIDRASQNFLPPRKGVGLARKIGSDLLLALIEDKRISSPWIHCSDADVHFCSDYFEQVNTHHGEEASALLYRFNHGTGFEEFDDAPPGPNNALDQGSPIRPGESIRPNQAALEYEISLRYYVLGLRFAGSHHAFHSIGSTLAIHANAYAKVRGFPKREAAEDFYLLNKLAKVGQIERLEGSPLLLSSRSSFRVPFGTGAAIRQLLEGSESHVVTYDPKIFHYLRAWHNALRQMFDSSRPGNSLVEWLRTFAYKDPLIESARLIETLAEVGAISTAEKSLATPGSQTKKRLLDGFDGFRTLKFVHALRASGLKSLPLHDALDQASFITLSARAETKRTRDLAQEIEFLEMLETSAGVIGSE